VSRTHFTQHGSRTTGDALDVLGDEVDLLRELFDAWEATTPSGVPGGEVVPAKWDHGTIGKLLLEHAAVYLAASRDVAGALAGAGRQAEAAAIGSRLDALRPVIDRMDDASHGVQPMSLAITPAFIEATRDLGELLHDELHAEPGAEAAARLAGLLGTGRSSLHDARFVRKHAPSHPGPPRWYDRFPLLVRVKAGFDRLRGFPWGESGLGDAKLAEHYDREV
jgi:hypothetical protein